jgi:hypothetical protein
MSAERALTYIIRNTPAITAIIGSPARVHAITLPQGGAIPAVALQRISTPRVYNLKGKSSLASPRIQLTLWADTVETITTLSAALRSALGGYKGAAGSINVQSIIIDENERDTREPETQRVMRMFDAIVWLAE